MSDEKNQPKVVVFSTPTCSYCNMAKSYFREKGIKFTDVDVAEIRLLREIWCAAQVKWACR